MPANYIGRKKMKIDGKYRNMGYEVSSQALNYLLYEKGLSSESPSVISDIAIPHLVECGDENLAVKVERDYITIAYIPMDTKVNDLRAKIQDN